MSQPLADAPELEAGRLYAEVFVGQFDESYWWLLYYAALPLVLTPELLGYLHSHFLRDRRVPWEAQADLLLSSLCHQVGYEQYVMQPDVRRYLLGEMQRRLGPGPRQQVSRLLIQYLQHLARTNPWLDPTSLWTQRMAAMVYLDDQRGAAVREITDAFRRMRDPSQLQNLVQLVANLAPNLDAYVEFVAYAREVGRLLSQVDFMSDLPAVDWPATDLPSPDELVRWSLDHMSDADRVSRAIDSMIKAGDLLAEAGMLRVIGERVTAGITELHALIEISELLLTIDVDCYDGIVGEARRFPSDRLAKERLQGYERELARLASRARAYARQLPHVTAVNDWLDTLKRAHTALLTGIEHDDPRELRRGLALLDEVLTIEPVRNCQRIAKVIGDLGLPDLIAALRAVTVSGTPAWSDDRAASAMALERLQDELVRSANEHAVWQNVVLELRWINAELQHNTNASAQSWPTMRTELAALHAEVSDQYALSLEQAASDLDAAIRDGNVGDTRQAFWVYRDRASDRFYRLHLNLLRAVHETEHACIALEGFATD